MVNVVVAAQNIPRGAIIPADQVRQVPWPQSSFLPSMLTDVAQVEGKIARYDIYREQPIHETMVVDNMRELGTIGSDAALQIQPGMVAMAVPFTRLSGVAFAVADGDQVDILASFLFVDLDEQWQTMTPNSVWGVTFAPPPLGGDLVPQVAPGAPFSEGRPAEDVFTELFANLQGASPVPFFLAPSEPQRPRLVSQRIIQNAYVLHVGTFQPPLPTAAPTDTPVPNEPTPTPPPQLAAALERPDIITLVVTPQDAVVLNYLVAAQVDLTFLLRSAGDTSQVDTESVTLQSLIDRFQIAIPALLEQGLEPPVRDIVPPVLPNDGGQP
jgi:pilus assembly protein CpaB